MPYKKSPTNKSSCIKMYDEKGKPTGLMMEGSVMHMDHESPATFTGMSGGSALHQEKPKTKKDSLESKEEKDLKMMKKLQSLSISFDSGKDKPKEQIKKKLKE